MMSLLKILILLFSLFFISCGSVNSGKNDDVSLETLLEDLDEAFDLSASELQKIQDCDLDQSDQEEFIDSYYWNETEKDEDYANETFVGGFDWDLYWERFWDKKVNNYPSLCEKESVKKQLEEQLESECEESNPVASSGSDDVTAVNSNCKDILLNDIKSDIAVEVLSCNKKTKALKDISNTCL